MVSDMTTALKKESSRLDKYSDRELVALIGIIEDIIDIRALDRSIAGNFKSTPWEKIEARLCKKFGITFD
jgi:hypothetical protein